MSLGAYWILLLLTGVKIKSQGSLQGICKTVRNSSGLHLSSSLSQHFLLMKCHFLPLSSLEGRQGCHLLTHPSSCILSFPSVSSLDYAALSHLSVLSLIKVDVLRSENMVKKRKYIYVYIHIYIYKITST